MLEYLRTSRKAGPAAAKLYWYAILSVVIGIQGVVPVAAAVSRATVQNFDTPGTGTSYVPLQLGNSPSVTVMPGGPTGVGNLLRLISAVPQPGTPNINTIAFPNTAPASNLVVIDFDFRITPGNAVIPGKGRADGFSFALLNTGSYTGPTVAPDGPVPVAEEPGFFNSLGVGFDIYKNDHPEGYPDDIGDDNIRAEVFSNSISIHFNGVVITQTDVSSVVDLAGGRWIHARILTRPGGGFSDISVILTPQNSSPVTVIDKLAIPGLAPYAGRAYFGGRAGGETADIDLDNINVQFLGLNKSIVSLSSTMYAVDEPLPIAGTSKAARITLIRSGDLTRRVEVGYTTRNGTAKAGSDYVSVAGKLTFNPGETKKTFSVPLVRTSGLESTEFFKVSLISASSTAVLSGPSAAVVQVYDAESSRRMGHWNPPLHFPIVAVHMHLLPTGRVMLWDRIGNVSIWDPITGKTQEPAMPADNLFCSGHAFLADGRLLISGGHHHGGFPNDDGVGILDANVYDPYTNQWIELDDMNAGRWYPTNTTLPNGEMLVISGTVDNLYNKNLVPQIWQPGSSSWRDLTDAAAQAENAPAHGADLYPWMFVIPDGRVFKAGPDKETWFLDPAGLGSWVQGPDRNSGILSYGTAVMYAPGKILVVGGGDVAGTDPDANAIAEVIDLNASPPVWRTVESLEFARRQLNATLLPNGQVLVTGGTSGDGFNNEASPVLPAEVWDPVTELWTTLPAMQITRGYHSTALLLPDGRILIAGGGQGAGATSVHNNAEIYRPSYLFWPDRPVITSAPQNVMYGESFALRLNHKVTVSGISFIRLPSVTHSFDQNQRFMWLDFSTTSSNQTRTNLSVAAPDNPNLAPPGHYMLFVLNARGVPSLAKMIQITAD